MKTEGLDKRETIQYLLEEVFLAALGDLENSLCGHEDTSAGFYAGAKAALNWVGKGAVVLGPEEDHIAVALRLREFIQFMTEPERQEPLMTKDGPHEAQQ